MKPLLINSDIAFRDNERPLSFVRATMEEVINASPRIFRSESDSSLFTKLNEGELLKCRNGVLGVAHVAKGDLLVIQRDPLDIDEEPFQTWLKSVDKREQKELIICSPNISHNSENLAVHAILYTQNELHRLFAATTEGFQFFDLKNNEEISPESRTLFYTLDLEHLAYQPDILLKVLLNKVQVDSLDYLAAFKADLDAFYAWAKENIPNTLQEAY